MKTLLTILLISGLAACRKPKPPTPDTFEQYVFVHGFDGQGNLFRGEETVPCDSPTAESYCATSCDNLLSLTNAARRLEAAVTEDSICSEESRGLAVEVADKVIKTYVEVWGIAYGLVFRGDAELSCAEEISQDLCAVKCYSLHYLTAKVRHLRAAVRSKEIMSSVCKRSVKKEFRRNLIEVRQMIESIGIEMEGRW